MVTDNLDSISINIRSINADFILARAMPSQQQQILV